MVALIIVDTSDPEQAGWLRQAVLALADHCDITICAVQPGSDERTCTSAGSTGDAETPADYERISTTADVVLLLDDRTVFAQVSVWQMSVSIQGFENYMRRGPGVTLIDDVARCSAPSPAAFILSSPGDRRARVGNVDCHFETTSAMGPSLWSEVRRLIEGHSDNQPLAPYCFVQLDNATGILALAPAVREMLSFAAESKSIRLVIVSALSQDLLRVAGFRDFTVVAPQTFGCAFPASTLGPDDVLVFTSAERVIAEGYARTSAKLIYIRNTNLLEMRPGMSVESLRELGADPAGFHKASLEQAYDRLACRDRSVSVVIPTFNRPFEMLGRAVGSALECLEHNANVDVVVVDDGSTCSPAAELRRRFGDQVRCLSKPNGGLGSARNFGVQNSQSDFVYFLDDDDEIVAENLPLMIAQAELQQSGMVVGKRVLCSPSGDLVTDSLDYCFDSVARSVTGSDPRAFDDSMANNKLIRRGLMIEHQLWFESGYYEDNDFAARALNELPNVWLLNFPIHRWYQSPTESSITTTFSHAHISDKIDSLVRAWQHLSTEARRSRIRFNLAVDLPPSVAGIRALPEKSARELTEQMDRYRSLWGSYQDADIQRLATDLFAAGHRAPAGSPAPIDPAISGRHFFFARTHFQVMTAMAIVDQRHVDGVLVLDRAVPAFNRQFLRRVRRSNMFTSVRVISNRAVPRAMSAHLRLGSAATTVIYSELFKEYRDSLPDVTANDVAVIFHEGWPERYFIARSFGSLVKAEDGYASTDREFDLALSNGVWGRNRAENGMWGLLNIVVQERHSEWHDVPFKADEILVAKLPVRSIGVGGYEQARVSEFDVALSCRKPHFRRQFKRLYRVNRPLRRDSSVILTQPLFFDYCTVAEHLAIVAYLVSLASEPTVVVKPHPMDPCEYRRVKVLSARNPSELLGFRRRLVRESISFGSTGGLAVPISESRISVVDDVGVSAELVKAEIRRICYEEGWISNELARDWLRLNAPKLRHGGAMPAFSIQQAAPHLRAAAVLKSVKTAGTLIVNDREKVAKAARRRVRQARLQLRARR